MGLIFGISHFDVNVVIVTCLDLVLTFQQANTRRTYSNLVTVGVVILLAGVDDARCINAGVNDEGSFEIAASRVKLLCFELTLGRHQVAPSECFNFPLLQGAVLVIETLSSSSG